MKSAEKTILNYGLLKQGDIVGVAVSGGIDSMALLHYLNSVKTKFKVKIVVITVDHCIRKEGKHDADFVENYCVKNDIEILRFEGNVPALSKKYRTSIEETARNFRYDIFKALIKDKVITKVAMGHHVQDQAETILLNILRGAGVAGASGMDVFREGIYIRPLLKTSKTEIRAYVSEYDIPYVEDETNFSNEYARNYVRNLVMPLIRNKWRNADQVLANFGDICAQDDEYIGSTIKSSGVIKENQQTIKIPTTYFVYPAPAINRIILKAVKAIGADSNFERKHVELVKGLAIEGENGNRISLPNKFHVIKEYNYVTITNRNIKPTSKRYDFVIGKTDITNFGVIDVKRTRNFTVGEFMHLVDTKKISKNAVWRFREDGDVFEKFGGGTKSLSDYLTDKKIPSRLRNSIPVLAVEKEILIVGGYEISEKVKVDNDTVSAYGINAVRFN